MEYYKISDWVLFVTIIMNFQYDISDANCDTGEGELRRFKRPAATKLSPPLCKNVKP